MAIDPPNSMPASQAGYDYLVKVALVDIKAPPVELTPALKAVTRAARESSITPQSCALLIKTVLNSYEPASGAVNAALLKLSRQLK